MNSENKDTERLLKMVSRLNRLILFLFIILISVPVFLLNGKSISMKLSSLFAEKKITPYVKPIENENMVEYWEAFSVDRIEDSTFKAEIMYGRELIVHTSKYFGPNGSIKAITNGLNCQNCHLDAGTKIWGNNYGSVASTYPKVRDRSGTLVDIPERINGCFQRSMNGEALESESKELQAMVAYMNYIGSNVSKGEKAEGSGFKDITYLKRPASPEKGKVIYESKCASCHMPDGQGVLTLDETEYLYPPLWGSNSFNDGAGLSRITKMARFVKYNMPLGVTHDAPQLTDEESWDVSAYLLSQKRPHLEVPNDWPDLTKKPIDQPFGPYADEFSELQHKFGPFEEIIEARNK
jgi:thiosulfate dehydrogenase